MLEITTKVDKFVKQNNLLEQNDFVVVGVSGGADSMLLLNYLISVKEDYNLKLVVANVEHGIRGQESIEDTNFVKDFCKIREIEFNSITINAIDDAQKAGKGVEEYSREKRYEFFNSFNADKIATAHNLTDNLETVLFRLARGTSLKGLCGIPVKRDNIIRPLLCLTGDEIRLACNELNIDYRVDSSNLNNDYTRNYIRNEIVPRLRNINSNLENSFDHFVNSIKEDEICLDKIADECFNNALDNNCLKVDVLNKYDSAIIKRTLKKYFSMFDVSFDEYHLNGVYKLVFENGKFQIKGDYFAISSNNLLRCARINELKDNAFKVKKKILSVSEFNATKNEHYSDYNFYCDYDKTKGDITVRQRLEGDSISPANRGCTKSLKKLFNEFKIFVEDRDSVPVICDENGVIGVYNYCVDERVKLTNSSTNVMIIKINLED